MKQTSFFLIYFNLKMLQFQLPNDVYLLISWWILYQKLWWAPEQYGWDNLCSRQKVFFAVTAPALSTSMMLQWKQCVFSNNRTSPCLKLNFHLSAYTFGYSFFSMIFRICLSFLFYSLAFKYTWSSPIFYETFALCHSSCGNFSYFCFRTKLDFSALLYFSASIHPKSIKSRYHTVAFILLLNHKGFLLTFLTFLIWQFRIIFNSWNSL